MNGLDGFTVFACAFLLTYLTHSTVAVLGARLLIARLKALTSPELRVLVWKLALTLPLASASAVTVLELPHFGIRLPIILTPATDAPAFAEQSSGLAAGALPASSLAPAGASSALDQTQRETVDGLDSAIEATSLLTLLRNWFDARTMISCVVGLWSIACLIGLATLTIQLDKVRRLRVHATVIVQPELLTALDMLRRRLGIRKHVTLLQPTVPAGPLTAGFFRPFILLPKGWCGQDRAQRNAILGHELAHIARRDAFWHLAVQAICRFLPFQPLNWGLAKQLRTEMDFVADSLAARTASERTGLARCLMSLGEQIAGGSRPAASPALAASMAAFDSVLGRRIEILLSEQGPERPSRVSSRLVVMAVAIGGAVAAAAFVPRAVAQTSRLHSSSVSPNSRTPSMMMNQPLATFAIMTGMAVTAAADDPQVKQESQKAPAANVADVKATPDPLPAGIQKFKGLLVGRLVSKDVEKGTFLVRIDAVPAVWPNNGADDPKSIVGKTVQMTGVFGRFLDVLVVARAGDTMEFECKHDGDRLVFPGEHLRKVAPFKPSDYPVLPEAFRGFQGTVAATIVKREPETFGLIVKVDRVVEASKESQAKDPSSIEGQQAMISGYWSRKDEYYSLEVGEKVEFGLKHIGLRGDHLVIAGPARKLGEKSERKADDKESGDQTGGLKPEQRGFRGMLVGRLVSKDVERGSFTITVDAVPRVWNNNKAAQPKSLLGTNVTAEGVTGKMLDALIVTRPGESIEFGALHDGDRMRVGEVLRKVAPVKPGDYPVLPDDFRGFKGTITAKVLRKDDHLFDMVVEISEINSSLPDSRAGKASAILGQQAMLAGFWQRKDAFHGINVGDTIQCGVEHPQLLSDHLNVIESVKKVDEKK